MLDDLRKKRDEEKTSKRKKQQIMGSKPNHTTLGFAGAQILGGFGSTSLSRDGGYQTAGPRLEGG